VEGWIEAFQSLDLLVRQFDRLLAADLLQPQQALVALLPNFDPVLLTDFGSLPIP
jgi:hypothetical protein